MPEGDTVYRQAALLHAALAGSRLVAAELRVPQHATADLTGWRVVEVVSRGKHLLHRLEPPELGTAGLSLHTHLMMDGSWHVYGPGERWRRPAHTARAVLRVEGGGCAVGFSLGITELLPTAEEARAVGHLGPDLLGPDWNEGEASRRLLSEPERPLGLALLDQRNLAGIGNIYRSELCFLVRLHPSMPVSALGQEGMRQLLTFAKRLLEANKNRAARNTTGGFGAGDSTWVYGRAGQPCLRCRTRIVSADELLASTPGGSGGGFRARSAGKPGKTSEKDRSDGRIFYHCPRCQVPALGVTP